MKRFVNLISAFAVGCAASAALAQPNIDDLSFNDPWIRGSVPGQKNGAGYLVIDNQSSQPAALVSVNSDRADRIELHTIVREDGVAKMREVQEIPVPANGSVTLQPGGYHVMFIGLKQPFKEGESIPVKLNFANGQSTEVTFSVKAPTYMGGGGMQGHGHGGHGMMKTN
ncbi:MAG: copper chaperone PCu(A)C [Burkholderiaceae bacterium]|nr:copper chaperone PCu(A)C [Burkholderiaceae bacterium]MCD8518163.1 copper chaperone PCu(A)C [Burkholderiaceae bacterium]MCD8537748.1 copper chaperone PCu(A)C [Burkholderiaceae bacterium]MCD8564167.1 copper chaperone PCu(A)C [Burkholderiaceae bacterium]